MFDKNRLKSIISKFAQEFDVTADRSRTAYIKSLNGGDRLPAEGKLYGEDVRRQFAETARQYGADAREIVDQRENEIRGLMAAAPSQDAVNALTMLKMRNEVSEEELNGAFDAYGDNYQCYKVLADIAADNNIRGIDKHPLETELEGLAVLKTSLARVFSVPGAESHTAGFYSMLEAQIDNVESNGGFFG